MHYSTTVEVNRSPSQMNIKQNCYTRDVVEAISRWLLACQNTEAIYDHYLVSAFLVCARKLKRKHLNCRRVICSWHETGWV